MRVYKWKIHSPSPVTADVHFMPVVPEAKRVQEMQRIGLSDSVIALAAGNVPHDAFEYRCKTPFYVYHGSRVPEGADILPLWDCGDVVTAVRETPASTLEFVRFGIEWVDDSEIVAHTEQGLLAHLFVELFEDNDDWTPQQFDDPANLVGFRYMPLLTTLYNSSDHTTADSHREFVRELVNTVDQREMSG